MISLTQFRKDLFKILKDQSDVSLELSLRRKIYKVDIKDTGKRKTTPYKKRGIRHVWRLSNYIDRSG